MAEKVVAISKIGHQVSDDEVVWFEPGEEVSGHGITDEDIQRWRDNGTVGEPPSLLPSVTAEKEALEARVAELEKQLTDAKKQQESGEKPVTSQSPSSAVPAQPGTKPGDKAPSAGDKSTQSSNK
jgi:hypothetical protein